MFNLFIEQQRRLNPSRPKLPIPGEFVYKSINLLIKEVKTQGYKFTGCHYLGAELWLEDNRPVLIGAAEFMREDTTKRYLYIPLSRCQDLLPFKLIGETYIQCRYPTADDLLIRPINNYPVMYKSPGDGLNDLLPGFQYAGVVVQDLDSTLYSYIDVAGNYSEVGSTYLSKLRPRGLDNPLGSYGFEALVESDGLGNYPSRLEDGWIGEYTGYLVIDVLGKKWYQYRDSDRYFLLDSPPSDTSRFYYYFWNKLKNPSINISSRNIDYVRILQSTTTPTLT